MFDFGMSSMFPPSAILQVIADQIEGQLKFEVTKFVMILDAVKNRLEFKINDEDSRRPLDQPEFMDAIKAYVEPNLKNGFEIQYVFVHYSKDGTKNAIDMHMINPNTQEKVNETMKL